MADLLSWAHEIGAERRVALEREAKHDQAGAERLVGAMFDGSINQLWRRLGTSFKETVDAYNTGGRFSDVSFSTTSERLVVDRRRPPVFVIELQLDRAARALRLAVTDDGGAAAHEPLGLVFVDDELLLWHAGQTENGYQLAKRLLKPRL